MPFLLIQGHWSRFSANSENDIKVRVTRIVQFWCRPAHLLFIFCFLSRFLESNMNKKQQNARLPSGSQCCIVSLLQWPRNCLCFEKTRIVPLFRRKSYLVTMVCSGQCANPTNVLMITSLTERCFWHSYLPVNGSSFQDKQELWFPLFTSFVLYWNWCCTSPSNFQGCFHQSQYPADSIRKGLKGHFLWFFSKLIGKMLPSLSSGLGMIVGNEGKFPAR